MRRQKNSVKQAVILAGGKGERLKPLTDNCPKPMVLVNQKPFVEYMVEILKREGIKEIVMLTGYLAEKVEEYFGDGSQFGINIKYSVSSAEDDTGTRIKKAKNFLSDDFFLMYGDVYWPALNLNKISEFYYTSGKLGLAVVCDKGENNPNFEVDDNGNVLSYAYGPEANNPKFNWTEVGYFILNKKIVDFMPEVGNFNLNKITLPDLVSKNQLMAWKTNEAPDTITSPENVFEFEKKMGLLHIAS